MIRLYEGAMARPYSSDLRARVVEAVDEGATRYEAAERFGITVVSAMPWHQASPNEGTIEAKPCGGGRKGGGPKGERNGVHRTGRYTADAISGLPRRGSIAISPRSLRRPTGRS